MRIISVNLNKRLGNATVRRFVESWAKTNDCHLLLAQEPWARSRTDHVPLEGYTFLGGSSSSAAWLRDDYRGPLELDRTEHWQLLGAGSWELYNVYLSAYSSEKRSNAMGLLSERIKQNGDRPSLVVGDFNLAPELEDGMWGEAPSTWTSESERRAVSDLLTNARLVDTTSRQRTGTQEYTIARTVKGRSAKFRCDLALASDYVSEDITVRYDHTTREGSLKFTDHSALVVDLPIALDEPTLFAAPDIGSADARYCANSHKTAMSRRGPSAVARAIVAASATADLPAATSVLDWGCGRARDVHYYRGQGLEADGYDLHEQFGWSTLPDRKYDLVTVVFVVNVLPNSWERLETLRSAGEYVRDGGTMVVASRSPSAIKREASSKGWRSHNDGHISHEGRGTFQKGVGVNEMEAMLSRLGFLPTKAHLKLGADVTYAVGRNLKCKREAAQDPQSVRQP